MVKLIHESKRPVAQARPRHLVQALDRCALQADLARIERVQTREHMQQCALARATRTHNGQHLAALHAQIEAIEYGDFLAALVIALAQAARFDDRTERRRVFAILNLRHNAKSPLGGSLPHENSDKWSPAGTRRATGGPRRPRQPSAAVRGSR